MADVKQQLDAIDQMRAAREVVNANIEKLKLKAREMSEMIRKAEDAIPRDRKGRIVMVSEPAKMGTRGRRMGG